MPDEASDLRRADGRAGPSDPRGRKEGVLLVTRRMLFTLAVGAALAPVLRAQAHGGHDPHEHRPVIVPGIVKSVDATAQSFVVHRRGGGPQGRDVTVNTNSETRYRKSDGSTASFSDLAAGQRVVVRGVPAGANTVLARQVMIVVRD